ncbi:MAG: glycosyltransferase family A protein [Nitrospiraceae bacterium]|nr:glycosyltransferase family A protein [Nitrospiraceae bacterium]
MQQEIDISVIIPTFNRSAALKNCLRAVSAQILDGEIEIIVIDDGSSESTLAVVREQQQAASRPLRYLRQNNKGPAAARNAGLNIARGRIVLFIGDDIVPADDRMLQQHLVWHDRVHPMENTCILGRTTWLPGLTVTPFMRWLEKGRQFDYFGLTHGMSTDFWHFYTSNISLKRRFLGNDRFDERFRFAAYEDVELGYRLMQRGMKIVYNSAALAHHDHPVSLVDSCGRAVKAGQSRALLETIVPTSRRRMSQEKWLAALKIMAVNRVTVPFWLCGARFCERRCESNLFFSAVYYYYHAEGYRNARVAGR